MSKKLKEQRGIKNPQWITKRFLVSSISRETSWVDDIWLIYFKKVVIEIRRRKERGVMLSDVYDYHVD